MPANNGPAQRRMLGAGIGSLGREELITLTRAVCGQAAAFAGGHGNIHPENIFISADGSPWLGGRAEHAPGEWTTDELEYMAPELFWSGKGDLRSDVYSVGLLLYAGVTRGRLPFFTRPAAEMTNELRAAALRRRMNGEAVPIPTIAGEKLGEVLRRSLAYEAAERYGDTVELSMALEACVGEGDAAARAMFGKSERELSEVERTMAGILASYSADEAVPEEPPAEPIAPPEPEPEPEPVSEPRRSLAEEYFGVSTPFKSEDFQLPELSPELKALEKLADGLNELSRLRASEPVPVTESGTEPDTVPGPVPYPELFSGLGLNGSGSAKEHDATDSEPAGSGPASPPPGQPSGDEGGDPPEDGGGSSPEDDGGDPPEERGRSAFWFVTALCLVAALAAVLMTVLLPRFYPAEPVVPATPSIEPGQTAAPAATPAPTPSATPAPTPSATPAPPVQPAGSRYELAAGDYSWTEVEAICREMGGHLAVVNDENELRYIASLAEAQGLDYLWIGFYRRDDAFHWVDNSEGYFAWAPGQPSVTDAGGTVESYGLLEKTEAGWLYDDVRNDPAELYPATYSGRIGFVCEYGN